MISSKVLKPNTRSPNFSRMALSRSAPVSSYHVSRRLGSATWNWREKLSPPVSSLLYNRSCIVTMHGSGNIHFAQPCDEYLFYIALDMVSRVEYIHKEKRFGVKTTYKDKKSFVSSCRNRKNFLSLPRKKEKRGISSSG